MGQDNLVKKNIKWADAMEIFTAAHTDTQLESQLVKKLAQTRMTVTERSLKYIERYTSLLTRLGYSSSAHDRVIDCERGLTAPLRMKLAEYKALQEATTGEAFECGSIEELSRLVAILEKRASCSTW